METPQRSQTPILDRVGSYRKLRGLSPSDLESLCDELRGVIQDVTCRNGGHLASSLGAVELIVSLLRVFDPGRDRILFDVGHQAYAYKLLTDRRERFSTLRRKDGISGFPRRHESPFDAFDVGHSSTSISAALGFAKARDLKRERHEVVAVIGDGALLNGLAFEGLNNVRSAGSKVLIVLNDNEMSINTRIGGMAEHLAKLSVHPTYRRFKQFIKEQCRTLRRGDTVEEVLGRWKTKLKSLLLPPNIFEEMDITYWGPFDGHRLDELEEIFGLARDYPESLLIHVITRKGKGCPEAEAQPATFHGVGAGTVLGAPSQKKAPDWSRVAARVAERLAEEDPRVVCCTAAMKEGTKLQEFSRRFPHRFFDVGISEGHLLTFAAGMAAGGLRPLVCIYSTFLQRAMDQWVHDICLPGLPVLLCVDRAGLVGEDGETHQGLLDLPWGRVIPGLTFMAPRDQADLEFMMRGWLAREIPGAIRYPRGTVPPSLYRNEGSPLSGWGTPEALHQGEGTCLVGVGSTTKLMMDALALCRERGETLPTVVDARFLKPLDETFYRDLLRTHRQLVVAEEAYVSGGFGESLAAFAHREGSPCLVRTLGVADHFVAHASRAEQWQEEGLTPEHILSFLHVWATASA